MSLNTDQQFDMEDNEDIEDLEHRLYAQIHYSSGNNIDNLPSLLDKSNVEQSNTPGVVSNQNETGASNFRSSKSKARYWSEENSGGAGSSQQPRFTGKRFNPNASERISKTTEAIVATNINSHDPPGKRPKPFTPYTPLLSDTDITSSISNTVPTVSKKSTQKNKSENQTKCINPFNKLRERHRKQKEKIDAKKKRADKSRKKTMTLNPIAIGTNNSAPYNDNDKNNTNNIDIDDYDVDDDDDVVIIPTLPPPLICIDDSSEEEVLVETRPIGRDKFIEPEKRNKINSSGVTRCPSPTSSIISDDFIGQKDRQRAELDAFGHVADDELPPVECLINALNELTDRTQLEVTETPTTASSKNKKHLKSLKKSYEVSEKNLTGVSDEPEQAPESERPGTRDTIYAKGSRNQKLLSSDSDSDQNIELRTNAKRLNKRKQSNEQSESSSSSQSEDNEEETLSQQIRNKFPYLVHGEALSKPKKSGKRKKGNMKRKPSVSKSDKTSDEEFLTRLSSICNEDGFISSEGEEDIETSRESIDARDIVQSVLQRRKKRMKMSENAIQNADNEWIARDQIGQIDDNVTFLNVTLNNSNEEMNLNSTVVRMERPIDIDMGATASESVPTNDNRGFESVKSSSSVEKEIGWNDEMNVFYNDSWGGETFSSQEIQHRMPRSYMEWSVDAKDTYLTSASRKSQFLPFAKCTNCHERGHRAARCPQPPIPIRCHMCSQVGHIEANCPNTICLSCGKETRSFIYGCQSCGRDSNIRCHLCKERGHRTNLCPDRWRRYHSTVDANVALTRHEAPLPIKPKYCSVCSNKGHIAENCKNALRIFQHPLDSIFIKNYEESYRRLFDPPSGDIGPKFITMSDPRRWFTFNFEGKVDEDKRYSFYGRFSSAVNLQKIKNDMQQRCLDEMGAQCPQQLDHENAETTKTSNVKPLTLTKKRKRACRKVIDTNDSMISKSLIENKNIEDTNTTEPAVDTIIDDRIISNNIQLGTVEESELNQKNNVGRKLALEANEHVVRIENSNEQIESPNNGQKSITNIENGNNGDIEEALNNTNSTDISSTNANSFSFTNELAALESSRGHGNSASSANFNLNFISKKGENELPKSKCNPDKIRQQIAELMILESGERKLEKIRDELILNISSSKRTATTTSMQNSKTPSTRITADGYDTDSNYSFSDYFDSRPKITSESNTPCENSSKESDVLPDYIPLQGQSEQVNYRSKSPTPPPAPKEVRCEAKIFLSKEHCKYLLSHQGSGFLGCASYKYDVLVRMEWRSVGNVLLVQGLPSNQDLFHSALIKFCEPFECEKKIRNDLSIPKSRLSLIKVLTSTILLLDKPMRSVPELYNRVKRFEQYQTKAATKRADQYRKELNMVLLGQAGLGNGRVHLTSLQQHLRNLVNMTDDTVQVKIRDDIYAHTNAIFSGQDHGNYPDLIEQYKSLKKSNSLPILNLDRKLLGLPINVHIEKENKATKSSKQIQKASPESNDNDAFESNIPSELETTNTTEDNCENNDEIDDDLANIEEKEVQNPDEPSTFWSKKCIKIVEQYKNIIQIRSNKNIMTKLKKIVYKAERNLICFQDVKVLCRIFNNIVAAQGTNKVDSK